MKTFWLTAHWLIGITAGTVLALVGATGALMAFEDQVLEAMNRGVVTSTSTGTALAPAALLARVQGQAPGKRVASVTFFSDPELSARVGLVPVTPPAERAARRAGPAPRVRAEFLYVDPHTGTLLGKPRGQGFFQFVEQLHRRLAAGDVGRRIVGACTIGLVVLALSGIYVRWPRQPRDWRAWFTIDFSERGRRFLWQLHAVVGTCVLLAYLLTAFTGLHMSYEWFRNGVSALTGAPRPARDVVTLETAVTQRPRIDELWAVFVRESGGFSSANISLPERSAEAIEFRYLAPTPAHPRAFSRLALHPVSGAVLRHERYEEKTAGARLTASIFPLHSGSYFGVAGSLVMMLAALCMPLFAVTGWLMYLARRRKARAPAA